MNVFNTLYASQYDSMYLGKSYLAECDLIDEAVKRFAGRRPLTLLDVGCGTGGHAFELSKRGYQVTGVDLSAEMLAAAQLKAETLDVSQKPLFVLGDARNILATPRAFTTITAGRVNERALPAGAERLLVAELVD